MKGKGKRQNITTREEEEAKARDEEGGTVALLVVLLLPWEREVPHGVGITAAVRRIPCEES